MIAAEKWYEYQKDYQKYGLDMKPKKKRASNENKKKSASAMTLREKSQIMILTVIVSMLSVGLIASTAYSAKIKYNINNLVKQSAVIEGEIENLNVKIKSQSNIQIIEEKAKTQLGMVYPTVDQYVYISQEDIPIKDFALALKQEAYN